MTKIDNVFRIFVSSTFEDMIEVREKLHRDVFPELRNFCVSHGARLQIIDLRWGVRREAALNHQTMRICIEEIKRCQKITPRPNFILLLGNRYGWRPIPSEIPSRIFKDILNVLSKSKENQRDIDLLIDWYNLDKNADPPRYYLKPRKHIYIDFKEWNKVEQKIRKILNKSIYKIGLDENSLVYYMSSATEQEIMAGVFEPKNFGHFLCFFRNIKSDLIPEMEYFIDLDDSGNLDKEANKQLIDLKDRLRKDFPNKIYEYDIEWNQDSTNTQFLEDLSEDVKYALSDIMSIQIESLNKISEIEMEISAHKEFAIERRQSFHGRKEILKKIRDYIDSDDNTPLVIFGKSGSGKSALISYLIKKIKKENQNLKVIYRFIGVTPNSSKGVLLLQNLCLELSEIININAYKPPEDYKKLVLDYIEKLSLIKDKQKVIVLIDALDQFPLNDQARNLYWVPKTLPENVKLVITSLPDENRTILKEKLPTSNILELKKLSIEEGSDILRSWLGVIKRTLQSHQWEEVITKFNNNRYPFFLKIAYEECRYWRSDTPVDKTIIGSNIYNIISNFSARLSLDENHGSMMVSHSLGYLAAAKNGLSENEIIDILSIDLDVVADFKKKANIEYIHDKLPIIVWSRLYFDLEPYLTFKRADGTILLTFFHRQIREAVEREYLQLNNRFKRHKILAIYFADEYKKQKNLSQSFLNLRILSELPYHVSFISEIGLDDNKLELSLLTCAKECLLIISKEIPKELTHHIDEIPIIANSLFKLGSYQDIIELTDNLIGELEIQCHWLPMLDLLEIGSKSSKKVKNNLKFLQYNYGFARGLVHRGFYKKSKKETFKALKLSRKFANKALEADILWHIGVDLRFLGKWKRAIKFTKSAQKIAEELEDTNLLVKSPITLGIIQHGLGNFELALRLYNKSYEYASIPNPELPDEKLVAHNDFEIMGMLRIRGDLGYQTGNIELARESWEEWLELGEINNSTREIKGARARLTLIDQQMDIHIKKQIWRDILEEQLLVGELNASITTYGELAELYIRNEEYKEAMGLCLEALNKAQHLKGLHAKSAKLYVKGILAIARKDYTVANKLLRKAERKFAKWTSPYRFWVAHTFRRLEIKL